MRACRQLYDLSTSSPPVEDKPVFVEGGAGLRINRIVTSIEEASFTGKGDRDKVLPRPPPLPWARAAQWRAACVLLSPRWRFARRLGGCWA